jgi:hypothetical protein
MSDVVVSGNDNFVIVAGGDVYLPAAPAAPSTGDDRRNLVNLLGHVRRIWITGVLERSVSHAALLDPQVRMEPGAVEPPWRRYLEVAGQPARALPPGTTIGRVFGEAGRMLLILGDPGAGKTTTLLALARECIERAERDPAAPVPVVLSLSSWTGSRPFHDWLADELGRGYSVGRPFARRWLEEHRLLLLLDGLDEVAEARRAACVGALHAFVEEHGVPGLAVCCRSTEYAAVPARLKLGGAVRLLPLEPAHVGAYLDAAGPALGGLRAALARNAELSRLSASPLMLSIMTLAFRGLPAEELWFDEGSTREELREEIFGRFVDRLFALRERPDDGFPRGRVEDGLRWLASGMMQRGRLFAVELLQPEWLTPRQLLLYAVGSRAGAAAAITTAIGVVTCLAALLVVRVDGATSGQALAATGAAVGVATLAASVAMGLTAGLLYGLLGYRTLRRSRGAAWKPGTAGEVALPFAYLLLSGLAVLLVVGTGWALGHSLREPPLLAAFTTIAFSGLALPVVFANREGRGSADGDISLAGILSWRWRKAGETALVGAGAGGILVWASPALGVARPLAVGVAVVAVLTLATYNGWRQEVPPVDRWREERGDSALRDSGRVFAYTGLACVAVLFPLLAFAMGAELGAGAPFGLALLVAVVLFGPALFWFGGIDLVLHATLRLVLSLTGTMPLRLRRSLDYAAHLGFLQRAGGGYIFFHGLLLEHFAARPARDGASAARGPGSP